MIYRNVILNHEIVLLCFVLYFLLYFLFVSTFYYFEVRFDIQKHVLLFRSPNYNSDAGSIEFGAHSFLFGG